MPLAAALVGLAIQHSAFIIPHFLRQFFTDRPFSASARPDRLVLMSDRGARRTTGSPKLMAVMAFLKSFGTIHEIFRPRARSTSSGSMSHPFLTNRLTTILILLASIPIRRMAPTNRSAFLALGT